MYLLFNLIEKLWKKIKQSYTYLHYFDTYEDLVAQVKYASHMARTSMEASSVDCNLTAI